MSATIQFSTLSGILEARLAAPTRGAERANGARERKVIIRQTDTGRR